jgi:hypothetical protein
MMKMAMVTFAIDSFHCWHHLRAYIGEMVVLKTSLANIEALMALTEDLISNRCGSRKVACSS